MLQTHELLRCCNNVLLSDSPEPSADFASNHTVLDGRAPELEADPDGGNGSHPPTGGRPSSSHPVTRRTLAQSGPAMTQWKAALRQADGIAPGGSQGPHSEYITQMLFTENGYLSPKDVVVRTLVFGDVSPPASTHILPVNTLVKMQKQRMWRRKRRKRKAATRYPPGRMAPYWLSITCQTQHFLMN